MVSLSNRIYKHITYAHIMSTIAFEHLLSESRRLLLDTSRAAVVAAPVEVSYPGNPQALIYALEPTSLIWKFILASIPGTIYMPDCCSHPNNGSQAA